MIPKLHHFIFLIKNFKQVHANSLRIVNVVSCYCKKVHIKTYNVSEQPFSSGDKFLLHVTKKSQHWAIESINKKIIIIISSKKSEVGLKFDYFFLVSYE